VIKILLIPRTEFEFIGNAFAGDLWHVGLDEINARMKSIAEAGGAEFAHVSIQQRRRSD